MNLNELNRILNKKYKGVTVVRVVSFKNGRYIVEAPKNTVNPDFSDPFYFISEDGKEVGRVGVLDLLKIL